MIPKAPFLAVILGLVLASCRTPIDFGHQAIALTDHWGSSAASHEALTRFEEARVYAEEHRALTLLAIQGTDIVYEWSRSDYDATTPVHLFSGTKSFSCAVAELLVADGLLDLDESVAESIPELAAGPAVTARHLLQFTSGIDQNARRLTIDGLRQKQRVDDKYQYAVGLPGQWEAGTRYQYGSSHQMVFGELVRRRTQGVNALQLLEERVFGPIGLVYAGWHHDPAGNPMLPYGAWTTAREWAKFGVLIRDDGKWEGRSVLPPGVRTRCTTGSDANPAYGMTWWLNRPIGKDANLARIRQVRDGRGILHSGGYPDAFMAAGHNDQRLYIIPSEDLVVVLLSEGHRQFRDREFLRRLLP